MKEIETISIRPAEARDYPDILRLNAANVSVLAPMDGQIIERFAEWAELFWVAEAKGEFAAFLIALREGVGNYWSENYKWFSARYPKFLYVDRIVLDETCRGLGRGRRLYELVAAHARNTGVPVVTAEIDTEPVYNDASLRFHKAMGFREIGTQYVKDGTIKVSLQAWKLDTPGKN